MRQVRRHLQADAAVVALGRIVDRAQDGSRSLDVGDGQRLEERLGVQRRTGQLRQVGGVGVALGDRLLEDRGVRRDAGDALGDEPGQLAGLDHAALDEVVPDTLAQGAHLMKTGHVKTLLCQSENECNMPTG
jgi:hypothetical protein